jgi:uncharacterized protein (DUF1015 family)
MASIDQLGIKIPEILLPNPSVNPAKWAVIACDQFTSEPEYWQEVEKIVGDSPSTYHMILPEVYLGTSREDEQAQTSHQAMQNYLEAGIFRKINNFIYVIRSIDGKKRRGLMVCLDLEQYDYNKGAQTLIRATEGTIIDRLPPRIRIREQAPLECPHILVLFDDPTDNVFGMLDEKLPQLNELYDFNLMLGSGHLAGFEVADDILQQHIIDSLNELINPEIFAEKYNLKSGVFKPLLFAMGDGNHSLATAKAIWEQIKSTVSMDHPARYALVEIVNVHDPALKFEPIHRLIFNLNKDIVAEMQSTWGSALKIKNVESQEKLISIIDEAEEPWHQIGMISSEGLNLLEIHRPAENLPVGTLQKFLDTFLEENGAERIDYVHGKEVLFNNAQINRNVGFYLPPMDKSELFKTVILDGALPRKTFSMGEAREKRFYMECRKIKI